MVETDLPATKETNACGDGGRKGRGIRGLIDDGEVVVTRKREEKEIV